MPDNKATATRFAVKSDNIFINSDGGRKAFGGNRNLTDILNELSGRFGQIWYDSAPAAPSVGDLLYSVTEGLKICTAVSPATWTTIVPHDISVNVFTGARTETSGTPDPWDLSAQKIAAEQYNSSSVYPKPGKGDMVIVTDTSVSEMFIISSATISTPQALPSDFTVEQVTSTNAAEIAYDNTGSQVPSDNVQGVLDWLAATVRGGRYEYTGLASLTGVLADDVPLTLTAGKAVPATGLKMLTCRVCIETSGTGGYIACGIRTKVFNVLTDQQAADTVTDYFTDDTSGTALPFDVSDIAMEFDSVTQQFKVYIPSGTDFGSLTLSSVLVEISY